MRRIAVINQKGGVGKTTTTANLGAALALAGRRVLLVDLDPQAHLSLHFGAEVGDDQLTVYDLLTASAPIPQVAMAVRENVTLLPSDIDLASAEAELISVTGREVILREAVDRVEGEYDVMLIDCPPSLGVLTINALSAVGEVIIPLQAHFFALQGLGKLLDTVMLVRQRINPQLKVSGVVLCLHESSTRLATEVVDDLTGFLTASRGTAVPWADASIYRSCIRRNIKLAEACSFGQTVFDYAPRSNGALDYAALVEEAFGVSVPVPTAVAGAAATEGEIDRGARPRGESEESTVRSRKAEPRLAHASIALPIAAPITAPITTSIKAPILVASPIEFIPEPAIASRTS